MACLLSGVVLVHFWHNVILRNREHHVPCERLPSRDAAEAVLRQHRDAVNRIQETAPPGAVSVEVGEPCPGKADIVIYHPSVDVRKKIERIIDADTFFGIPYRLINV